MQNKSANTYAPAEDTFFLADHIKNEKGQSALEIGTGSGYLAKILEKNFDVVIATDIDHTALYAQDDKIKNRICCTGADALGVSFELVVCNLPYLPTDQILDRTTDGGPEGLQVPLSIIRSASACLKLQGKLVCLTSSLANYQKLIQETESLGFTARIVAKKKIFFEELIIVEAVKLSS